MQIHFKKFSQNLPIDLSRAWDFFSTPENLARITPEELGFAIKTPEGERGIYPGKLFYYTVKPILGIPLTWVSEITAMEDRAYFIDVQVSGPYALWHHEHRFTETPNGVHMEDKIHYAIPFGFLGSLANRMFVSRQIDGIFAYREQVLKKEFGS